MAVRFKKPTTSYIEYNMKFNTILKLRPTAVVAKAIHDEYAQTYGAHDGLKFRKTVHTYRHSAMHTHIDMVVKQPGSTTDFKLTEIGFEIDFAAVLVGPRALVDNCMAEVAPLVLPLVKAALRAKLPGLPAEELESITDDHVILERAAVAFYFRPGDPTEAARTLFSLFRHAKTTVDSSAHYPVGPKKSSQVKTRIVVPDDQRKALEVELIYGPINEVIGTLRAYVMHDFSEEPSTFAKSLDTLKEARYAVRGLLCIEVVIDTSKGLHFGEETNIKLPVNCTEWAAADAEGNPFELIWAAVLYALWLNFPLASNLDEVQRDNLTPVMTKVLDAYLDDKIIRVAHFPNEKDFANCHRALIRRAKVDILIRWADLQLNLGADLVPKLAYNSSVWPGEDALLADHTLSRTNVAEHVERVIAALDVQADDPVQTGTVFGAFDADDDEDEV